MHIGKDCKINYSLLAYIYTSESIFQCKLLCKRQIINYTWKQCFKKYDI